MKRHTTHRTVLAAICPVDQTVDHYRVVIETADVVQVERIIAELVALDRAVMFQEEIAARLADRLCCTVTLTGTHSGITTITRVEP